jgi:hypothetical protein
VIIPCPLTEQSRGDLKSPQSKYFKEEIYEHHRTFRDTFVQIGEQV